MKRLLSYFQKHLGVTRSEAVAVTFLATTLTVGTVGIKLWPTSDTHDHATAQRIALMIDSIEAERTSQADAPEPTDSAYAPAGIDTPPTHKPGKVSRGVLNLNVATLSQLQTLPGIGPSMAQRIVEFRQRRPFGSVDDLLDVRGIGEKKLAKLRPYVKVP